MKWIEGEHGNQTFRCGDWRIKKWARGGASVICDDIDIDTEIYDIGLYVKGEAQSGHNCMGVAATLPWPIIRELLAIHDAGVAAKVDTETPEE